ncbi:hypothetical protein LCGC14_2616180, partial [marine sediment metagenome]
VFLSFVLLLLCTTVHCTMLRWASNRLGRNDLSVLPALLLAMTVAMTAHAIDALIYAGGFWAAIHWLAIGDLKPPKPADPAVGWMDIYYFSLVNLTTLGRGDLVPTGHLRFMAGMEAAQGFLIITASGSYIFQVMAGKVPFRDS